MSPKWNTQSKTYNNMSLTKIQPECSFFLGKFEHFKGFCNFRFLSLWWNLYRFCIAQKRKTPEWQGRAEIQDRRSRTTSRRGRWWSGSRLARRNIEVRPFQIGDVLARSPNLPCPQIVAGNEEFDRAKGKPKTNHNLNLNEGFFLVKACKIAKTSGTNCVCL